VPADLGQGPPGTVEEAGKPELGPGPVGEAVCSLLGLFEWSRDDPVTGHSQRHEGHHVEDPDSWMDPLVALQVEGVDDLAGEAPDRLFDFDGGSGQGEDGPMVVGISVLIEEGGTAGLGEAVEEKGVATLTQVDDRFEDGRRAGAGAIAQLPTDAMARRRRRRMRRRSRSERPPQTP
jgi:hypothetical protein